jgi:hypothetical protein
MSLNKFDPMKIGNVPIIKPLPSFANSKSVDSAGENLGESFQAFVALAI